MGVTIRPPPFPAEQHRRCHAQMVTRRREPRSFSSLPEGVKGEMSKSSPPPQAWLPPLSAASHNHGQPLSHPCSNAT